MEGREKNRTAIPPNPRERRESEPESPWPRAAVRRADSLEDDRDRWGRGCFEEVARHEHGEELAVAGEKVPPGFGRDPLPEAAGVAAALDPEEVGEGQEDEEPDDPGGEEEVR